MTLFPEGTEVVELNARTTIEGLAPEAITLQHQPVPALAVISGTTGSDA